jgi:hypothetical protein
MQPFELRRMSGNQCSLSAILLREFEIWSKRGMIRLNRRSRQQKTNKSEYETCGKLGELTRYGIVEYSISGR